MTATATDRAGGCCRRGRRADVRRGLGAVHRLVRRHRHTGRCPPTRPPSSRSSPTARPRRRPSGAGSRPSTTTTPPTGHPTGRGSRRRCGPRWAGPPANHASTAGRDRGRGRGGAARRCPVPRLDAGHVRPPGPLPAGAVPTGGGAVQAPRHADRRRRHRRRRRRDDPLAGRGVDASSGRRRPCCVGRARSPGGCGSWTWSSPSSAPGPSPRR